MALAPTLSRALRCAGLLAAGLTLSGCSSSSYAGRVSLRDFSAERPTLLTLASRSHMEEVVGIDPVDWFSETRDSVDLKVAEDKEVAKLVRKLDGLGFDRWAADGAGAGGAESGFATVVEIEVDGRTRHLATSRASDADRLAASVDMKWAIIELYNKTLALQTVTPKVGEELFEETLRSSKQR
jgi:hypothetical protein